MYDTDSSCVHLNSAILNLLLTLNGAAGCSDLRDYHGFHHSLQGNIEMKFRHSDNGITEVECLLGYDTVTGCVVPSIL